MNIDDPDDQVAECPSCANGILLFPTAGIAGIPNRPRVVNCMSCSTPICVHCSGRWDHRANVYKCRRATCNK